jgi:hypothetical protein
MTEITLPGGLVAFDPRGVVEAHAQPLSPRPPGLDGRRLGVLDNSKWNANRLLASTLTELSREVQFADVTFWKKESFSRNAPPELLERIVEEADLALIAIGD